MSTLSVLYDGWSLIYQPNSPTTLHLWTLLAQRLEEIQSIVALPDRPPEWFPEDITIRILPTPNTERAHLVWEQRSLPSLADELGVGLIHLTSPTPPLFSSKPLLVSPTAFGTAGRPRSFTSRMREAMAKGGMSRIRGLLWPEDLPPPDESLPIVRLPPTSPPGFTLTEQFEPADRPGFDLPETYILYQGSSNELALSRLISAWSWASGAIGEYYPLLAVGMDHAAQAWLEFFAERYHATGTLRIMPPIPPSDLPSLYRGCAAVINPSTLSPWAGVERMALVAGKPLVAIENPLTSALVGPAAYLIDENNPRGLGAALITVIVEEGVAERLSQAAKERAESWDEDYFQQKLLETYQIILSSEGG